jgi:hypothetical protein
MKGSENSGKPKRAYYYYHCKGKYEDSGSGGRRRICGGHIFTLESSPVYCPACGEPLGMLESDRELPEAVTCAMEKCLNCNNRQRSAAVNDGHCLGGARYKDGRIEQVTGSQSCKGCLCADCCRDIIDDMNAGKKHGLTAVVKAQAKLRDSARQILRSGVAGKEAENMITEAKNRNEVLRDIQYKTFERWAMNAWNAAKKELPGESKERRTGGLT